MPRKSKSVNNKRKNNYRSSSNYNAENVTFSLLPGFGDVNKIERTYNVRPCDSSCNCFKLGFHTSKDGKTFTLIHIEGGIYTLTRLFACSRTNRKTFREAVLRLDIFQTLQELEIPGLVDQLIDQLPEALGYTCAALYKKGLI